MSVQVSEPMRSDQALKFCEDRNLVLKEQHPYAAFYYSQTGVRYVFIQTDKGIVAWIT